MAGVTNITATDSSVRLNAANSITLGNISAMDVSIIANAGSIKNDVDSTMNVTATNVHLAAHDNIGASTRHITTTVETLSALSTGSDTAGSTMDLSARNVNLAARDHIGASARHITTTIDTLSALNTGTDIAGIFITETDDLIVDSVTAAGTVEVRALGDLSVGTISATSLVLSGASFINKKDTAAATITADDVTLVTHNTTNTSTVSSTLIIDGDINTLAATTSMQTLSLNNATDLTLSSITMEQGNLIVDVKVILLNQQSCR
jgi:hypothetical protein